MPKQHLNRIKKLLNSLKKIYLKITRDIMAQTRADRIAKISLQNSKKSITSN